MLVMFGWFSPVFSTGLFYLIDINYNCITQDSRYRRLRHS